MKIATFFVESLLTEYRVSLSLYDFYCTFSFCQHTSDKRQTSLLHDVTYGCQYRLFPTLVMYTVGRNLSLRAYNNPRNAGRRFVSKIGSIKSLFLRCIRTMTSFLQAMG